MSANTKFTKQSILGKPPSSLKSKLYSVNPFPNSKVIPKVGESNAMSNPITSTSAPSTRDSKVVKNDNVVAPGMFRIDPPKTSRVDNVRPNKPVKTSIRTNPITVSQPYVISQENVNPNLNGISSTGYKDVELEEPHRNLLLSTNKKHMSSECNNIKLAIWNDKSEFFSAMLDDYSRYTWVHFLKSKDEAPEVIKNFLKKIQVLLQAPVIIARTENAKAIATACYTQNRSIIHRQYDKIPYNLINGRKPDISFLHVFGALCYPKNDHEDIGKLGAKDGIAFSLVILLIPVLTDSKHGLQSMTSGQISSGLDLTYAPSRITSQKLTERELDLLFEAMYDDYIGGQPPAATRTATASQAPQVLQTPTTSTTTVDTAPTPINSSPKAIVIPNTS
ncbi:hypothetical protein Tco_0523970 [Tanacetum coccineum]